MDREKLKIFDRDAIKTLAVFIMFWGHLFAWLAQLRNPGVFTPYEVMPLWQNILSHLSLFCPPVMFFMAADGYKYTRDRKRYALRLLVFACITQIPYWILWVPCDGWWGSNVIFSLLSGLLAIMAWESGRKLWQRLLIVLLLSAFTVLIMNEWMIFGVVFILVLHIFRDRPKQRFIAYTLTAFVWKLIGFVSGIGNNGVEAQLYNDLSDLVVVLLAYLCMTVFYNGKKGKHPVFAKWFFYIFYPVHYLIIYAVYRLSK